MIAELYTSAFCGPCHATRAVLADAARLVPALQARSDRPRAIVAHLIKGLGVRSVQGTVAAHYWKPTADELRAAIADADADVASLSEVLA